MPGADYTSFILDERDKIEEFILKISTDTYEYVHEKKESSFVLFYKYLTHSDLATFGKATEVNSHDKNLLYYIGQDEMADIEKKTGKPFQTTHQSCIGLKAKFYELVNLPNPRDVDPYLINDYINVYLVNKSVEYFSSDYTQQIFNKLGKKISTSRQKEWRFDRLDLNLSEGQFTPIELHCAVHGLGMKADKEFHKLRHHMFKGDTFILLVELTPSGEDNMFVLLEKNPIFFSILGETNKSYEDYQVGLRKRLIEKITAKENAVDDLSEEVTRQQQSAWRKMLANEMMGYTQVNNQVFCPFTYITIDFETLGTLFVASHIKGFSDPNTTNEEKYDINNGILICANADALFDKHLISIDEDKQLIFSFLLDADVKLKTQLLLMQPIFQPILNEKRMEYIKYHREVFYELEAIRRKA